jgi:hypothetical protein
LSARPPMPQPGSKSYLVSWGEINPAAKYPRNGRRVLLSSGTLG